MNNNLRLPSSGSQLAVLLLTTGCSFILAAAVIALLPGVHAGQMPTDPGAIKLLQGVISIILFGVPSIIYAVATFRKKPLQELGFRPAEKPIFYLIPIVLLIVSIPLEGWLGMINKQLPMPHWMHDMERSMEKQVAALLVVKRPIDLFTNILVIAVIPGIVEEAGFRGALQRILIYLFKSPWVGIILSGAIFSACHGEFEGFLARWCLGILLGASFWYSRSLWPVIFAHAFFNGFQVVAAAWYPKMVDENPKVPFYWALLSLIFVVGLLAYMRRRSTVTYAQVYQNDTDNGRTKS